MEAEGLEPAVPPLPTTRIYFTNFFVARVAWWHRPEVQGFLDAVNESGGVYRHRWGDAPVQTAALRLFARSASALRRLRVDYVHMSTRNLIVGGEEMPFGPEGVSNLHFRRLAQINATTSNTSNATGAKNASTLSSNPSPPPAPPLQCDSTKCTTSGNDCYLRVVEHNLRFEGATCADNLQPVLIRSSSDDMPKARYTCCPPGANPTLDELNFVPVTSTPSTGCLASTLAAIDSVIYNKDLNSSFPCTTTQTGNCQRVRRQICHMNCLTFVRSLYRGYPIAELFTDAWCALQTEPQLLPAPPVVPFQQVPTQDVQCSIACNDFAADCVAGRGPPITEPARCVYTAE
eukprot:1408741-Prymnesium_polylepis.1